MKKNNHELEDEQQQQQQQELEIIKAVAQAWHGQSTSSKPSNEFDAHRRNFKNKPSRFKLEAMSCKASSSCSTKGDDDSSWDFGQSLLDSYEIVAVTKRLESGLMVDDPFNALDRVRSEEKKKRKESKNSLRSLFNK